MAGNVTKTETATRDLPVVYEVRLTLDAAIQGDFDRWLAAHAEELTALPGFLDARIIHADPAPDGRPRRIVRYRLQDRAALEVYLASHAERKRGDAVQRFGDRFQAERDVYPALAIRDAGARHRCPACGAPVDPDD